MTKVFTFLEYDSMLEQVTGTLTEVFDQIVRNIKEAQHITDEEKVRLCAVAADDLAERLAWQPPPQLGRPPRGTTKRKELLGHPYSVVLQHHRERKEEHPIDKHLRGITGGKTDEDQ